MVKWQTCLPAGRHAALTMEHYIYAIKSITRNYIYVGLTNNIDRRLEQHNGLQNKTTRSYAPFRTLLIEKCSDRIEARKREKYFKSGIGKEYLKTL